MSQQNIQQRIPATGNISKRIRKRAKPWKDLVGRQLLRVGLETLEDRMLLANDFLNAVLGPVVPPESLIYRDDLTGDFAGVGETDSIPLPLDSGQKLSLVFTPQASSVAGTVRLLDAVGGELGSVSGGAGETLVLANINIATADDYVVSLANSAGTGSYSVSILLNATPETEGNNTLATANSIQGSSIALPGTADRVAAVGELVDTEADYFSFTLSASLPTSLVLDSTGGAKLTLLDGAGTALASAVSGEQVSQVIAGFVAGASGTFYARVDGGASGSSESYSLTVVRGSEFSLEPNGDTQSAQNIDQTQQVVGALGGSAGSSGAGTIRVGVFNSGYTYSAAVVTQLNDDSYFDFNASLVVAADVDTLEELDAYDAIVIGDQASAITTQAATAIRDWNAAGRGGVIGTGWLMYNVNSGNSQSIASRGIIDEFIPLRLSGTRIYPTGNISITDLSHPVTAGLTSVLAYTGYHDLSSLGADADAQVLGTAAGQPTIIVRENGPVRNAYLGTVYFDSYATKTGDADRLFEQAVAWVAANDAVDHYLFTATAGDNITLSTTTPGDGSRQPSNDLDPAIDLYFVDGGAPDSVIATNNDSGGHNAVLTYSVPNSGLYRAVVRAESGGGAYTLDVAGASGATVAFQVNSTTPADNRSVNTYPTFRVKLSSAVLLTSLQASDLSVNGSPADGFTIVDGQTIDFDISSANVGDGTYSVQIAAGALTDVSGNSNSAFNSTFNLDTTPPKVISYGITEGEVLTTTAIAFAVQISEDLDEAELGPEDVLLVETFSGASFIPQSFSYSATTDLLSLAYGGLPQGNYSLTLRSQAHGFVDLVGNLLDGDANGTGGDDGLLNFVVDYTQALPVVQPIRPAGSLIYDAVSSGALHTASDTDSFTIALSAGQTLSVLAIPLDDAQLRIDFGAENASATGVGLPALLQTAAVPSDTTYAIDISSLSGDGRYQLRIFLNSAVEEEQLFAVANDDQAGAEVLDGSAVVLAGGASRLAVVGVFDGGGIVPGDDEPNDQLSEATQTCFAGGGCSSDYYSAAIGDNPAYSDELWLDVDLYRVEFVSEQNVNIDIGAAVYGSPLNSYLRVFDAFGFELASNDDEAGTLDSFLSFIAPASGTYYIGVSSLNNNGYNPAMAGSGAATAADDNVGYYYLEIYDVGGGAGIGVSGSAIGGGGTPAVGSVAIDDVYSFTLAAGVPATLVLTSLSGQGHMLLRDDAGNLLASGIGGYDNVDQSIVDFTPEIGGTFYVYVSSAQESDYALVVTRGATFDLEQNSEVADSQSIGHAGQVLGSVGTRVPTGPGDFGTTSLPVTLVDGGGYSWDIQSNGRIEGSVPGDPVDSGFELSGLPYVSTAATHQSGREIVHGPHVSSVGGLDTTRSVFVPDDRSFARFLDVFTNSTNHTIDTTVYYYSNVDSLVTMDTSSGDTVLTNDDYWLVTDDGGGPDHAFAHVVGGPGGLRPSSFATSGDNINWTYNLRVAPGETVALLSFGIQDIFSDPAIISNSAAALASLSGNVFDGLTGAELDAIINFQTQSSDSYFFDVTAATTLTLSTTTPGAGAGQPANALDPTLELYYLDGATPDVPVAVDGASGNANLTHIVDGSALGRYRVVVKGAASRGEFTLMVDSSVAVAVDDTDPFEVVASLPADAAALPAIPSRFRIDLSHGALVSSASVSDLTFTGPGAISVTDVKMIDGDTLEFVLDGSAATDGTYTASLAAGVLTSLAGDLSEAFSTSFALDSNNPTIISSTITEGQVLPVGSVTFSAVFSEDLNDTYIGPEDIGLYDSINDVFHVAVSGAYNASNRTYTANFVSLPESLYSIFLFSTAFRDLVGNALDGDGDGSSNGSGANNFVVHFATDTDRAFNVPFRAVAPGGSLIYEATTLAVSHATGDVDLLSVDLEAGQTATIVVRPDAALRSQVALFGPGGSSLGSASASSLGELVVLQTLPVATAGIYKLAVTSLAGAGAYTVQVYLNSTVEAETLLGTANDTTATAQAIDGSSINLVGGSASRLGAVGQVGNMKLVDVAEIGWTNTYFNYPRAFTYAGAGTNKLFMANYDFSEVSLDGDITLLGSMDHTSNGLAFVGTDLYSGAGFGALLYRIDPTDGSTLSTVNVTEDGSDIDGFNGLATDPTSGLLYAIIRPNGSSTSQRYLATVDVTTGVATVIGDMGNRFSGIAFANDGTLYAATGNSATPDHTLFEIDKTDASSERLATLPTLGGGGQALAFNSDNGLIYRGAGYGSEAKFQSIAVTEIVDSFDVYSIALQAGDFVTSAATGNGDMHLELLDSGGNLIALGSNSPINTDSIVRDFLVPSDGNYFARLSAPGGRTGYSLLVTRGMGFELEPNSDISQAKFIGPTNSVLGSAGSSDSGDNGATGSTSLPVNLSDGSGLLWDIQQDGNISNGSSDAFDGGFILTGFPSFSTGATEQDGREIAIGPSTISGLSATRKIYIPADANFARFLDSFTNTTSATISTTIGYSTNLGSDGSTIALGTSSGDTTLTAGDNWIVTDDTIESGGDPAVAHVVAGAGVSLTTFERSADNINWAQEITVAPGETVSLLYFGIQNFNRTTALERAAALSAAPPEALLGLSEPELSSIANWQLATLDNFLIEADANAVLTISTTTPGDEVGEFNNGLDPIVELYYADGAAPEVLIASDDNSASDGRNALLTYTVPSDAAGIYRVLIRGVASRGEYTLSVTGANPSHEFSASAVSPVDGELLSAFPATFQVEFNQSLLLSSIDAGDLRVNGMPATSVTIIDGGSLEFGIASLGAGDGIYTVTIAPGALTSVSGAPSVFFSSTFDADTTSPTVLASSLSAGDVVGPGNLSYQATFSESLATVGLGAEDVVLVDNATSGTYPVDAFAYDDASRTITVSFVGLPEGDYTLTLTSSADAFRDRRGNLLDGGPSFPLPSGDGSAGDSFVVPFSIDVGTTLFPTPLGQLGPEGGLVFGGFATGVLAPSSDTDAYSIEVEAGQLITVSVLPLEAGLRPIVDLKGLGGTTLATGTALAAGQQAVVQVIPAPVTGNYTITVRSADATAGSYAVAVYLNSQLETEAITGTGNNSAANAESLDAATLLLDATAGRVAVLGMSDNENDFYRFSLTVGQTSTIAALPLSGTIAQLELLSPTGTPLGLGILSDNGQMTIRGFTATVAGEYVVRVRGGANTNYVLVATRDADLDLEPNDDLAAARPMIGSQLISGSLQSSGAGFQADFSDNSDNLSLDGFTASGLWHVTDASACGADLAGHSGPNFAYFGIDASCNFNAGRVAGTLTSPALSLRADSSPELRLNYRFGGEGGSYDRTEVRVSTDGGTTYTTVADKSTFLATTVWTARVVDLSPYAGQTIVLQFWFDSMDSINNVGLGWQIDDLEVTGVTDTQDHYSFLANEGDELTISTQTPGDPTGQPDNSLDPVIELYTSAGLLLVSDDNSADDGRNAQLTYTVPAGVGNKFIVRVAGQSVAGGGYLLSVAGSTGNNQAGPIVTSVLPSDGQPLAVAPANLVLTFSEGVLASSITPSDLVFDDNTVVVTSVQLIDGQTVSFSLNIPSAVGTYTYSLAADAISDLQGQGSVAFAGSFVVDRQGPRVVATNPAAQASAPFSSLTFVFDEFLDIASISIADDIISFIGPSGAIPLSEVTSLSLNGNLLKVGFNAQTAAGTYTMKIGPRIADAVGNLMDQDGDGIAGEVGDTFTATLTLQSPDLTVAAASTDSTAEFGGIIGVTYTVNNNGADPANEGWNDAIYLSTDTILDRNDVLLKRIPNSGQLGPLDAAGGANATYTRTEQVQLPLGATFNNGTYYLIASTDDLKTQPESSESNNALATSAVTISLPPLPDFFVSSITLPAASLSGQDIQVRWTLENQGDGDFTGTLRDQVFLSSDTVYGNDLFIGNFDFTGTLAAGATLQRTQVITLPITLQGTRYAIIRTDATNAAFEHDGENNNVTVDDQPIIVSLAPFPNLQVTSIAVPAEAFSSQSTVVEWVVTNAGDAPTSAPQWYDAIFLSSDDVYDSSDVMMGAALNASFLNPAESYTNSMTVTMPQGISGQYHFVVVTDLYNQVFEHTKEDDNSRVAALTSVQLTPPPDLQVTVVASPAGFSGQPTNVSWTVTNEGPGVTLQTDWWDSIYLSQDDILDGSDTYLGQRYHSGALAPEANYNAVLGVTLPIGVAGDFYYIVQTDRFNQVFEHAYEDNNTTASALGNIQLTPPPDLQVTSLAAPATAVAGHATTLTYEVLNAGATETPNSNWLDRLYLSTDNVFDPATDLLAASRTHYGKLESFASYTESFSFLPSLSLVGDYYAFVWTDADNAVFEGVHEDNNTAGDPDPIAIAIEPPDLVVNSFTAPATGQSGQSIVVGFEIKNDGVGDTISSSWRDRLWLSTDSTFGNGDDVPLKDIAHGGLLGPSQSYSVTGHVVALPITLTAGNYFLFLSADAANQVAEPGAENNNTFGPLAISIERQTADLQVTAVSATPVSLASQDNLSVTWTVTNAGSVPTETSYWYDQIYLSADPVLGFGSDTLLGTVQHSNIVAPGTDYTLTRSVVLPFEVTGDYYIIVVADTNNRVFEEGVEDNNDRATDDTIHIALRPAPDLVVTNVDAPASGFSGQLLNLSWTVENAGATATVGSWYDAVYLSLDQVFDRQGDVYLGYKFRPSDLAVGQNYTQTAGFEIPLGLSGPYYVFVAADSGGHVFERGAEANNVGTDAVPVDVVLLPPADLVVGTITIPASGVPGQNATITYTILNNGTNPARGAWNDTLYISADNQWDFTDAFFGETLHSGDVAGGNSYTQSLTAPLPGVLPGDYHVIVRSDIRNHIVESNEANNIGASLDLFDLDATQLVLGTAQVGTLANGQSVYYKMDLVAGETVRLSVNSDQGTAFNDLFVRYGQFPTRGQFDHTTKSPFQADPTIILPVEQTGTYYVLLYGNQVSGVPSYSILAEVIPFSLFDVQSDTLGNNGNATVAIDGARFTANTQFELFATIATVDYSQFASATLIEDSTLAYATFDLLSLPAGLYNLRAVDDTDTAVLADAITVKEGVGDDVVVLIDGPTTVRPNRITSIGLDYGNLGDQDTGAPLLLVTSPSNTPMGFHRDDLSSGPLHVLGASPDGPLDILRPGSRGTANILYNSQTTVDISIEPFTPADAQEITEDEWLAIEAAIRPAALTNFQWNPYWADVQPRIGSTWGDYVGYLNRLVKELSAPGQPLHDVRSMMERAFLEIPDFRPGRTYTGQLVDEVGAPVVGAQVAIYRGNEQLASRATTDSSGQYVLSFRDSGSYSLAVETPYTWDIDQDGYVDFDSPQLTLDNSADVTEVAALHVERTLLDTRTQSNPVLMTDADGTAHLVFHREGKLWHSYYDGTQWIEGQVITDVPTYNLSVVADSQVIGGTDPGLIATWEQGLENESEIYYAVAKKETDGSFTWSTPLRLTNNALQDADPTTIVVGGQLLTVYLIQNKLIQDDQDLYFDLADITTGGLTFPSFVFSVPEGDLLPAAASASVAFGWEKKFGPWNFLGAEFEAKAELNGQLTAKCAPDCEFEAQASGGFGGGVKLPSGNKIEGSGNGSIKGTWKADPTGTDWVFQGASMDANGSLSFNWDGGLTTVLGWMGPQGRAASTFITEVIDFAEWWFPSIDISEGIKFTGGVGFEGLGWSGSAPFPDFILPDSVQKASITGGVGPYLGIATTSGSVEASISGNVSVTVQVYPTFKIGPISGTVSASAVVYGWQYGPASFQISVLNSLGGDGLSPSDTEVPFTFNPAAALGSANVYGTNSVLSNVASDLRQDSTPVLGRAGNTTYLGWIADGDPTASTPEIGSFIKVADFNGTGFDAPQTLPGSLGFNRYLQTGVDASGNRVAVWSMADSTGLGSGTTLEQLQTAMRDTDVVYSVFDGTNWSTPAALPSTPGTDAALSLDTTAEGDLLLTWSTHDETNGYRLMSHRWNDATNTFGSATVIATGNQISDTEVGIVGGKTTVFWTVDTDPDADVTLKNIFSSTFESGSWSTPQEFAPQIAISAVAQAGQLYSENFLQSLPTFPMAFASMAETLRGDVLAAWSASPESSDGSTQDDVLVSLYQNGAWSPTVAIPNSLSENREITAATNVAGDLLVIWLSVQDEGDADILSSVYRDGYWSSPFEVARNGGENSQVRIGLDSLTGKLIASWISEDAHGTRTLFSSVWDGQWLDAQALAAGDDLTNGFMSIDGGETIATWTEHGNTYSSRLENATWSPAALATQAQMAAGALAVSDLFLVPSILASLGTSNLAPLANTFRFLPVPEDCKKCKELEEIRRGSGDCGYKVEFDEENCKRITYYKPCVVRPSDPNDILGPTGFGEPQWISATDVFDYTIRFENQPTATAAAQEVVITQQFDEDLNPAKFKIGSFGFRNLVFDAPNKPFHFQQIDLTEDYGVFVTLTAVVDIATNTATWTFRTIDPTTGQPPLDASLGFLPINDETGVGEGFVSYTIEADAAVPTGTVIDARSADCVRYRRADRYATDLQYARCRSPNQ